jgi:hypothetical protein
MHYYFSFFLFVHGECAAAALLKFAYHSRAAAEIEQISEAAQAMPPERHLSIKSVGNYNERWV